MKCFIRIIQCIIAATLLLSSAALYADDVDVKMNEIITELSQQYVSNGGMVLVRQGIAVLPFKEELGAGEKNGIAETVREAVSRGLLSSNVFVLVDRDTLEYSMKEMELSMTGMVDDASLVKAGKLSGIKVFLRGTVTKRGDLYVVNARLVDAESGRVVAAAKREISSGSLKDKKEKYAYEYISQYGLGINYQLSFGPHIKSPRPESMFMVNDIYVN